MQEPTDRDKIQQTAIRLLARREHSTVELRQKLTQRGFPAELIAEFLQKLADQGLQSDLRFAESYSHARAGKGYGPLRITAELQQRGVAAELIEQGLAKAAKDWLQQASQQRIKRFGRQLPKDLQERARQMRFLQYRGFSHEHIRGIFSMIEDCN